jgi:4,5-dihydroxyphthalate decarboxylase
MSKLRLSFACWNYDRTRALMDGSVQPDGIDLNYLNLPVVRDVAVILLRQFESPG